jgi:hypothetical protein
MREGIDLLKIDIASSTDFELNGSNLERDEKSYISDESNVLRFIILTYLLKNDDTSLLEVSVLYKLNNHRVIWIISLISLCNLSNLSVIFSFIDGSRGESGPIGSLLNVDDVVGFIGINIPYFKDSSSYHNPTTLFPSLETAIG